MESLLLESMYDVPGSSVRYVLVDLSVVLGQRPAQYWARGEGGAFYSALSAEEALAPSDPSTAGGRTSPSSRSPLVDEGELELQREVKEREGERERNLKEKARARGRRGGVGFGSNGGGFP